MNVPNLLLCVCVICDVDKLIHVWRVYFFVFSANKNQQCTGHSTEAQFHIRLIYDSSTTRRIVLIIFTINTEETFSIFIPLFYGW